MTVAVWAFSIALFCAKTRGVKRVRGVVFALARIGCAFKRQCTNCLHGVKQWANFGAPGRVVRAVHSAPA